MIYGPKLKQLREQNGLSQYALSEILNLNKRVYGQYEREYVIIPIKHLITISNYFNVSIDYIFGFTKIKQYKNITNYIDRKIIRNRLKKFRKENKLTQSNIAQELNIAPTTYAGYESGRYLIATPFLYMLCKKYNISADYILGRIN